MLANFAILAVLLLLAGLYITIKLIALLCNLVDRITMPADDERY